MPGCWRWNWWGFWLFHSPICYSADCRTGGIPWQALGIAVFAYPLWLLPHSGFIPISRITIIAILVFALAAGAWAMRTRRAQLLDFLRREWRTLLVAEAVFLAFFLLWLGLVSEFPAINHTEKPMDFAFLNASQVSTYLPPEDPWLSGHPISYYYFGHFMMGFLSKLAAVPSNVGYNIAISLVPALVVVGVFGYCTTWCAYRAARPGGRRIRPTGCPAGDPDGKP